MEKIVTYESLFKDITAHVENIETDHVYPCDGIEVETPSGWVGVLGVMKKTGKGVRIVTADGAIFHGEEKHTIFGSEGWEYLKDVEFVVTKENSLDKVISREYTGETTFYDISIPSPHSYYSPNGLIHHNTFVVTQTVNSEGLQKGKDWFIIKGKITTASLYQTLFMHREGGLLIFDDADSVWGDAEAANVLKAALDSYETRTISWISGRTVNVSRMSDEEKTDFNVNLDRKIQENPEDPKNKFPSEFEFEGRIIFISNLKYEKFDSAVLNRSAKIDMSLTQDQVFLRMKSILQHLGDKSVPIDIKVEILGFLQAQTNKGLMTDVSMRTFVAAEDTYRSGLPNWKDLIDYV